MCKIAIICERKSNKESSRIGKDLLGYEREFGVRMKRNHIPNIVSDSEELNYMRANEASIT